jgi:hypothetical protein
VSPRSTGGTKHCHPQGRTNCFQCHQRALNNVTPRRGPSVSKVTKHCHPQGRIQGRIQFLQNHQMALNIVTPRGGSSVSKITIGD